ncbi:MAG: hypothetical protein PF481_09060 [Bacteroidales bacterium]|nr:hypothetical protein [Bacteroidales bacterium]
MDTRLFAIQSVSDIAQEYQNTPIQTLIEYHNFAKEFDDYTAAKLLIGTCMDNRISLRFPDNFSFVIRSGGASMKHHEFHISYALAVANIGHIALITHTKCGMVAVPDQQDSFVSGLVRTAGWQKVVAEQYYASAVVDNAISHEIDFTLHQTRHLRGKFPEITIAPLLYDVDDHLLYGICE